MNLAQYDRKNLRSIENELHDDKENTDTVDTSGDIFVLIKSWTFVEHFLLLFQ